MKPMGSLMMVPDTIIGKIILAYRLVFSGKKVRRVNDHYLIEGEIK